MSYVLATELYLSLLPLHSEMAFWISVVGLAFGDLSYTLGMPRTVFLYLEAAFTSFAFFYISRRGVAHVRNALLSDPSHAVDALVQVWGAFCIMPIVQQVISFVTGVTLP
jgi:hypothetical protein